MLARDFCLLCIGAGPCWTRGFCKGFVLMVGASRIIVLGAGRGCFPCPHILPKALSSFVVALAFAGLWHMGILRGLRSVYLILVRGGAIA